MIKCSNVSVYIYTIMQFSGRNHLPVLICFSNADRSCKPTFSLIFFLFYMYSVHVKVCFIYDHI